MHLADLSLPIVSEGFMLSLEFQPMTFGNGEQSALAVELQTNHIYSVLSFFPRMVFQRLAFTANVLFYLTTKNLLKSSKI